MNRQVILGRVRKICLGLPETSERLSHGSPTFFVPPYVGYLGWVGVRLDRGLAWEKIRETIEDAYLTVAPKTLITAGEGRVTSPAARAMRRIPSHGKR